MWQVAFSFRFSRFSGSLPFHEAHFSKLGEEKAKCNLEIYNPLSGTRKKA